MSYSAFGKVLGGILFPISLSIFILIVSLAQITDREKFSDLYSRTFVSQLPEEIKLQVIGNYKQQCEGKDSVEITTLNGQVSVDCSKFSDADILGKVTSAVFNSAYSKTYDCDFVDCANYFPEIIATSQGNRLIHSVSYIALLFSLITGAVLAASLKGFGKLKGVGVGVISAGILYLPITLVAPSLQLTDSAEANSRTAPLLAEITGVFAENFLVALYFGIALTAAGFIAPAVYGKNKGRAHRSK